MSRDGWMKAKYIGPDLVALEKNKIYEILDSKHGSFEVMTELGETYYIPQSQFEIVED